VKQIKWNEGPCELYAPDNPSEKVNLERWAGWFSSGAEGIDEKLLAAESAGALGKSHRYKKRYGMGDYYKWEELRYWPPNKKIGFDGGLTLTSWNSPTPAFPARIKVFCERCQEDETRSAAPLRGWFNRSTNGRAYRTCRLLENGEWTTEEPDVIDNTGIVRISVKHHSFFNSLFNDLKAGAPIETQCQRGGFTRAGLKRRLEQVTGRIKQLQLEARGIRKDLKNQNYVGERAIDRAGRSMKFMGIGEIL